MLEPTQNVEAAKFVTKNEPFVAENNRRLSTGV